MDLDKVKTKIEGFRAIRILAPMVQHFLHIRPIEAKTEAKS